MNLVAKQVSKIYDRICFCMNLCNKFDLVSELFVR